MRWGVAIALTVLAVAAESSVAAAQSAPPQCATFGQLRAETQKKAVTVRDLVQKKADRKEICAAMQRFYTAEEVVVKFLQDNKTWCGIPDQAIKQAKINHEQTLKYRTAACTEAPQAQPRAPSLSDAIGTPSVDTGANTKTGRGTLDSLNGNPLAK
jgi:hypothetical protein